MKKEILLIALLLAIVLLVGVQAVQLNAVGPGSTTGAATAKQTASPSSAASEPVSVPSNIQNLPNMVGGC